MDFEKMTIEEIWDYYQVGFRVELSNGQLIGMEFENEKEN